MDGATILSLASDRVVELARIVGATALHQLFSPGSGYSLIALAAAFAIAAGYSLTRRRTRRPVPLRVLARAVLPRRVWRSASGRADAWFAVFNVFFGMLMFGWAILGQAAVSGWILVLLSEAFGVSPIVLPNSPGPLAWGALAALATGALFLAYELAYWLDHYLSHKVPFLWQFHQVHHSAESLSLLTNFRVHPVDTIVFYNCTALLTGITAGALKFLFGGAAAPFTVDGANALSLAATVLLTNLHHSHLWIGFGDRWGRIFLSPAHHQIHHSADPAHYDRNFGNSLALFDRLFGTLHLPAREREPLRFGVPNIGYDPHDVTHSLWRPCVAATRIAHKRAAALARLPGRPAALRTKAS